MATKSDSSDPVPPAYFPRAASPLALHLTNKAAWAAATFSALPYQTFKTELCKALP